MNSIWIVLAVALWLFLGYRIYGSFIERRLKPTDKVKTPAVLNKDKTDYSPASKPFLVGHHFASIAGAGPIIGPILAVSYFGWLPVVLWIAIGSVFIGAMHDYVSLMASVRNKAKGVAKIARDFLNTKSGWIFGLMIFVTLILIITVFSVSAAESIIEKPDLVIPLLGITLIAIVLGFGVQKLKWNYKLSSAIALIFVFFFVWLGNMFPVSLSFLGFERIAWVTIIILYAGIASVVPVSVFLRPRDYLSSLQMILILVLGIIALVIVRPEVNAPMYISGNLPLWPILFVTVACGAISGFHGLVSSGTTSKQLAKESHGKSVGYGSMILEGSLAVFVTLVAISGLAWGSMPGGFQEALGKGWIVLFSSGFGNIVGGIVPFISVGLAALLGAFMVNQFILTSVDTSSRLGRFVISESLFPRLKNKWVTTGIVLIPAWLIGVTNSYQSLWKLFGSSNQLIASISLIAISAFFVSRAGGKKKVGFILIPGLFVLVTTLSALLYLTFSSSGFFFMGDYVLALISMGMFVLGVIVAWEGFVVLRRKKV